MDQLNPPTAYARQMEFVPAFLQMLSKPNNNRHQSLMCSQTKPVTH